MWRTPRQKTWFFWQKAYNVGLDLSAVLPKGINLAYASDDGPAVNNDTVEKEMGKAVLVLIAKIRPHVTALTIYPNRQINVKTSAGTIRLMYMEVTRLYRITSLGLVFKKADGDVVEVIDDLNITAIGWYMLKEIRVKLLSLMNDKPRVSQRSAWDGLGVVREIFSAPLQRNNSILSKIPLNRGVFNNYSIKSAHSKGGHHCERILPFNPPRIFSEAYADQ